MNYYYINAMPRSVLSLNCRTMQL